MLFRAIVAFMLLSFLGCGQVKQFTNRTETATTPELAAEVRHGWTFLSRGEAAKAVEQFAALNKRFPNNEDVLTGLGAAYERAGNHEKARKALEKAVALNNNNAQARTELGLAYLGENKLDAAAEEFSKALSIKPDPSALAGLARVRFFQRKLDEAVRHYQEAIKLDPRYSWGYLGLAEVYEAKGKIAEAVQAAEKGLALNPNIPEAPMVRERINKARQALKGGAGPGR